MIVLYELAGSPTCRAVKMTLKLLNLDFEIQVVDLMKKEQHKPEYLKLNPFHSVPTIVDNGFSLYESRAIMTYLVNKYAPDSKLYPKDPEKRALVDQFLHADNATLFSRAVDVLHSYLSLHEPSESQLDNAKEALTTLDGILSARPYMTGDTFTLADISVSTTMTTYDMSGYDYSEYKNIVKYMSKIRDELDPMYSEVNDSPVAGLAQYVADLKTKIKA